MRQGLQSRLETGTPSDRRQRARRRRGTWQPAPRLFLLLALLSAGTQAARAGDTATAAPEYKIKAGYLYNFLLFAKRKDSPDKAAPRAPIVIGILGTDRFGDAFAEVEDKPVAATQRPLRIRRLGPYSNTMVLGDCDLLFIDASERKHLPRILADAHKAGVLTVSDQSHFVDRGGTIGMVIRDEFVRWEINRTALREAGISVSSQLLRNAVRVIGSSRPPREEGQYRPGHRPAVEQHLAEGSPCARTRT